MIVIMFQWQFADAVITGRKRSTIRPPRKRPVYTGDQLSLRRWEGKPYRSRQAVLRDVTCTRSAPILIDEPLGQDFVFEIDGWRLNQEQWSKLARREGFRCTTELLDWFKANYGLPFEGVLIEWGAGI